jgi:hypothetical protein
MDAKRCDRCKEFYIGKDDFPKFDFGELTPKGYKHGTSGLIVLIYQEESGTRYRLDLCPTCQTKIANFIMNKEEL